MNQQRNFLISAGPLLLVLFIDGMGLGLVIPILNGLIFDANTTFLDQSTLTPLLSNLIYGGILGVFMLCWFFGAAAFGDLSDHIGRKKALMLCLFGAALSYLMSGIAVVTHSLTLLILGRVVAGLTAGSQPIAQAAIVDLSTEEHKVRNIGFVLLALSLGFIFGPLFGGILSDTSIVSWFDFSTPFYFSATLSFINMLLLGLLFKETFVPPPQKSKFNLYHAVDIFLEAFRHVKIKKLSIMFFIFIFGWSSCYSFISLFLIKTYDLNATKISFFMALMGIGFGIGNGFLVDYFSKRYPLLNNFVYSTALCALCILLILLIPFELISWLMIIPLATCVAIAYATAVALFSNQVDADSQGWVMGITGSIMALVWAINSVVVGTLATWSVTLPLVIAFLSMCLAIVYVKISYRPQGEN